MTENYNLQIAKVVGTPSDGTWSQVHTFSPEEANKKEKRGDLLAVLVISGVGEGVEAVAAGREILGRLHEEYYGNLEESAFERLKQAVGKLGEENEGLEIVAAVLVGKALYLAILGWGKILLKRGSQLGVVLKGVGDLSTASGFLEEGDFLVIGSLQFFEVVGQGVLKASLENGSPEEAVETLAPIILGRSDMASAAAILTLVTKMEETSIKSVSAEITEEIAPGLPGEEFIRQPSTVSAVKKSPFSLLKMIKLPTPNRKRRQIFVRTEADGRKKRFYFLVSLIFLIILGVSLGLGLKKKAEAQKSAKARELIKSAEEKLNSGKLVAAENPTEGKVLVEAATKLTQEALTLQKNNEEALFVQQEAKKFLSSFGQEISGEPSVFMDLNLIEDGAQGNVLALSGNNLVILDQTKNKIFLLNTENKSYQAVENAGSGGALITSMGKNIYVFEKDGIFEAKDGAKKTSSVVDEDEKWEEIVGFSAFSGNLYLLDIKASNIWRYPGSEGKFGTGKSWFVETPPDLSGANSMTIDGSIWIVFNDKIQKFTYGKIDNFSLSKMPENLLEAVRIYTSDELENIYVLDKGRGKVYQIGKSGEFKAAYFWEGLKTASDLVAVESSKKLFVLSGTKILEIGLK